MLLPCTVTLAEPVLARLVRRTPLAGPISIDQASVRLPVRDPAVTDILLDPRILCSSWHLTRVSDSHSVDSQALCPVETLNVRRRYPKWVPYIVMLDDPVAARFVRRTTLMTGWSEVQTSVSDPCLEPAVAETCLLPRVPWPIRHRRAVSASHSVDSQAVWPTRLDIVYVWIDKLLPWIVTLDEPVPARLLRLDTLRPPISTDHASVTLPDRDPAVTDTRRLPFTPCIIWHRTDVSVSQCVASHPECPARILCV